MQYIIYYVHINNGGPLIISLFPLYLLRYILFVVLVNMFILLNESFVSAEALVFQPYFNSGLFTQKWYISYSLALFLYMYIYIYIVYLTLYIYG